MMKKRKKRFYEIVFYDINGVVETYDCNALSPKQKIKAMRLFCPKNCLGKIKIMMI